MNWLRSEENWKRPSSWLLIAVVAANMLVPVGYWVFGDARSGETASTGPEALASTSARSATADATDQAIPADGGGPGGATDAAEPPDPQTADGSPSPAAVAALPVEPVRPPDIARRAAPPARVCRVWGPFPEEAQARSLATTLELDDFEVRQAADAAQTEFLVRARVEGGADAGERAMERLTSEGLDSYILSQGAEGAVLAVGVFSNQARAETQRERMDELGYTGSVQPLSRSGASYHLLARVPPDFEPEQPFLGLCSDIAPSR